MIKSVKGLFFSPTGSTKKVVEAIGKEIAETLNVDYTEISVNLPEAREKEYSFSADELVVIGSPVFASRIPNKILPFFQEKIKGDHTPVIPIVTFGNRSRGTAVLELALEAQKNGCIPVKGAAIVAEHSMVPELATGRPDAGDLEEIRAFAHRIAESLKDAEEYETCKALLADAEEVGPYYKPLRADGEPAKFLKAKPLTHEELCVKCGTCARVCCMGSISKENFSEVTGVCIKCHACVRSCPKRAKYFDDPDLLSHHQDLRNRFSERNVSSFFE